MKLEWVKVDVLNVFGRDEIRGTLNSLPSGVYVVLMESLWMHEEMPCAGSCNSSWMFCMRHVGNRIWIFLRSDDTGNVFFKCFNY